MVPDVTIGTLQYDLSSENRDVRLSGQARELRNAGSLQQQKANQGILPQDTNPDDTLIFLAQ